MGAALRQRAINPHGICLWFTGLSGAGKSTTANVVLRMLTERGRTTTLLDGDQVRTTFWRDLGFSKADRDANVMRVAELARTICDAGEVTVCALISPYAEARGRARRLIGSDRFVEIFVDTPLDVCEQRDPKGLYARARRGEIRGVTGIDAPYEAPAAPDLVISTERTVEENAAIVVRLVDEHAARCNGARSIRSDGL